MNWATPEQQQKAKQIDLLSYLQVYEPNELRRSSGGEFRTATHDSLIISNGKWHWGSRGFGGKNALDYLIKVREMGFVEAVHLLSGEHFAAVPIQPVNRDINKKAFALPEAAKYASKTVGYLQDRGIDADIVKHCLFIGIVFERQKYHNCVFIGRDKKGIARFACERGITGSYKRDVAGSEKRFGFALTGTGDTLYICESAIDALSRATLDKMEGLNWQSRHYLSLGGTSPLAAKQYLADHTEINIVYLCLDNDLAGVLGMFRVQQAIRSELALHDVKILIDPPPTKFGKDYNEYLCARQAENQATRIRVER